MAPRFLPWTVAIVLAAIRLPSWRPPLRSPPRTWRASVNLAALALAIAGVAWLYRDQLERAVTHGVHWPPLTLGMVNAILIGPVVEEWIFRGVLWRALVPEALADPGVAVTAGIATSIAFAFWHLPFNPDAPLVLHAIFGAAMATVRWRSGSVVPGVVLHAAANALNYFVV